MLTPGPLAVESLSAPLQKMFAPGAPPQLKLMAARGLAPMGPADLLTALYQLSQDPDAVLVQSAQKTAGTLPDKILQSLGGALHPLVLDFFARVHYQKLELVELLLLNRACDDDTFVFFAQTCDERELELLATNEERLLRSPRIIEALYMNKNARMSTVDRVVELAIRNGVACEGIEAWDSIVEAFKEGVDGGAETDEQFKAGVQADEELSADLDGAREQVVEKLSELMDEKGDGKAEKKSRLIKIETLSKTAKIRLAQVGNASARAVLIRDPLKLVALAVVASPALRDDEAIAIASNKNLRGEILSALARKAKFIKIYQVKYGLVFNPKCPLPITLKLVPQLHESDCAKLAKAKSVPSQVQTVARRMVEARTKKGG
jgi:hypothetical protein